ncbi:MAG: RodZ domain-containing protein [Terriglobia bacterium]
MAGFGENLRREREMRAVTLQEIADTTKISVRLLEALENEEFSRLPGGIFTRSFIRSYANYLGLDQEQVIAEYELAAPPKGEEDFSRIGVSSNNAKKKPGIPILPWLIAVVLLAGGYSLFRYTHRATEEPLTFGNPASGTVSSAAAPASTPGVAETKAPPVIAPAVSPGPAAADAAGPVGSMTASANPSPSAPAQTALPPATTNIKSVSATAPGLGVMASTVPGAGADGAAAREQSPDIPAITPAPGQLVLQIAATQRAWVAVNADGKTVLERILNPHEIRTLVAKKYFDVTTGNALGTVLTLNGVTLKPLGRSGEVKTVHLTSDSLKSGAP